MAVSFSSLRDTTIERQAAAWMNDPYEHFGYHNTRIHSLPREEVQAVQLAAMNMRLEERRGQITMLQKLADGQAIGRIDALDDMAPLLMPHDVYKSYPVSLLAKLKFDKLNGWLAELTRHDPSAVDVSACDSIDSWLTRLRDTTPLDVATSSGSTGTCSFFPKSKRDYRLSMMGLRVQLSQKFGEDPRPGDVEDKIHAIIPLYRDGHALDRRVCEILRERSSPRATRAIGIPPLTSRSAPISCGSPRDCARPPPRGMRARSMCRPPFLPAGRSGRAFSKTCRRSSSRSSTA